MVYAVLAQLRQNGSKCMLDSKAVLAQTLTPTLTSTRSHISSPLEASDSPCATSPSPAPPRRPFLLASCDTYPLPAPRLALVASSPPTPYPPPGTTFVDTGKGNNVREIRCARGVHVERRRARLLLYRPDDGGPGGRGGGHDRRNPCRGRVSESYVNNARQHLRICRLRICRLRLSGSSFGRKLEHGTFCTENSVGHTLPYTRISAWP